MEIGRETLRDGCWQSRHRLRWMLRRFFFWRGGRLAVTSIFRVGGRSGPGICVSDLYPLAFTPLLVLKGTIIVRGLITRSRRGEDRVHQTKQQTITSSVPRCCSGASRYHSRDATLTTAVWPWARPCHQTNQQNNDKQRRRQQPQQHVIPVNFAPQQHCLSPISRSRGRE